MAESSDSKRLWRTALIVAGAGVLVLVPLWLLYVRMSNDATRRRVANANEADTRYTLELIAAAEDVHLRAYGDYGTLRQLTETGILQITFDGETPARSGYVYTVRLMPKADGRQPTYGVNADPVRDKGREATGRRHFYVGSEAIGMRFNEERPATASDKPVQSVLE